MRAMVDVPTLETARLRLRPYRLEDYDAYAAMWADPQVVRYIGGKPFSREAAWTRFLRYVGIWQLLGFGFLVIEEKSTGRFGGECGFHDLHRAITPSNEGTMEAGYGLVAALHGQGLAEEAMRAMFDWAAVHGRGDRYTAIVDPENLASLRVAEKLGFKRLTVTQYNGAPWVLLEQKRVAAM